jgi:hypothetical protein
MNTVGDAVKKGKERFLSTASRKDEQGKWFS